MKVAVGRRQHALHFPAVPSEAIAGEILDAWFNATYQTNPEDEACLAVVAEVEPAHYHGMHPG